MNFIKVKLGQLFYSQNGDTDIKQKDINNKGEYVCSSGDGNFGIIGKSDIPAKLINANSITVDMFGNVHYRDFNYKLVTHARIFTLEGNYSKNVMLYFTSCLKRLKLIYSFDNMCSWKKIKEHEICLPSSDGVTPDFDYMDNYIKKLEKQYILNLQKQNNEELNLYLEASDLNDITISDDDLQFINKNVEYKSFSVGDLFYIKTGRDVIINTLYDGEHPLISHQCNNNGITKRIAELNNRNRFNFMDTIPLADRGVFHASCQNEDFYIGTRVKALTFKDGEKTENQRLFIVGAINKLQILFSDYLTNATDKLPNLEIYLPITPEGNPNYDYMDKYIRIIKKIVIKNIFEKQNEKLNMIKKICET